MIKIKLLCWWTSSGSLTKRFIKQFVSSEELSKYQFVDSNPDVTVVFGRPEHWEMISTDTDHTVYFSQEPLWSHNEPKDTIHEFCGRAYIADKHFYPDHPAYIESLLPMFYGGGGEADRDQKFDWDRAMKDWKYEDKTKGVSVICRNRTNDHFYSREKPPHFNILYKQRTELSRALAENDAADVYGGLWEPEGRIKGNVYNKHVGLNDYSFSVGMENTCQKNYISEKFWDIILTDSVPIYWGCKNISSLIPEGTYVNISELTTEEQITKIKNIDLNHHEYYNDVKHKIFELKQDFFRNPLYNIWERFKTIDF